MVKLHSPFGENSASYTALRSSSDKCSRAAMPSSLKHPPKPSMMRCFASVKVRLGETSVVSTTPFVSQYDCLDVETHWICFSIILFVPSSLLRVLYLLQ